MELNQIQSDVFKQEFEGINGNTKVVAILDENCVRYMVFKRKCYTADWKLRSRHEFSNSNKALCMKNATKALNK